MYRRNDPRMHDYIEEQLETRREWHQRAGSGAWICPFCLGAAPVRPEKLDGLLCAIVDHLANRCGPFGSGMRPDPGVRREQRLVVLEPSWRD